MSQHTVALLPIPRNWSRHVQSAVLRIISLAHFVIVCARARAARSRRAVVRLAAENDRLQQEVSLLREELRIKDARFERVPAQRRPHYSPTQRMAILELRAARGWTLVQTAQAFLVAPDTIAAWTKRLDRDGPEGLLKPSSPVNTFPELVHYLVQRLKVLCPSLGKVKLAENLCRAGLRISPATVGRIHKEPPERQPAKLKVVINGRRVTADRPNHVWHVDLTVVPTSMGLWAHWFSSALPQQWPFCWWVALTMDHFSRRVMAMTVFPRRPGSQQVRRFLGRIVADREVRPKYLICDKGKQFWCAGFRRWCRRKGIRVRYGAVGEHGSLAVIERFIRTLKQEGMRRIVIPMRRECIMRELRLFADWYNRHRPHSGLGGKIPEDVYRQTATSAPLLMIDSGSDAIELRIRFLSARRHLPIVTLQRAA